MPNCRKGGPGNYSTVPNAAKPLELRGELCEYRWITFVKSHSGWQPARHTVSSEFPSELSFLNVQYECVTRPHLERV